MPIHSCDHCHRVLLTCPRFDQNPRCPGCDRPLRPASREEALEHARSPRAGAAALQDAANSLRVLPGRVRSVIAASQEAQVAAANARQESRAIREELRKTREASVDHRERRAPQEEEEPLVESLGEP